MAVHSRKIPGNLILREGEEASKVAEVAGALNIYATNAQFLMLTSIEGELYISAEGSQFPVLTSVGGGLYISAEGSQFPVLTSVGGGLSIKPGKRFHAPQLREIGGKPIAAPEDAAALLRAVAEAATAFPDALSMDNWHCRTSHCIAGWAVHLAPGGYELEDEMEEKLGPRMRTLAAGNILLGAEASALFFLDNDAARAALHRVLDGKPALGPVQ